MSAVRAIRDFLRRFKWSHVGTVSACTQMTYRGKETNLVYHGAWVLKENGFGMRAAKLVGDHGGSGYALHRKTLVKAWVNGAPLPPLDEVDAPRPKAQLIAFPGGLA